MPRKLVSPPVVLAVALWSSGATAAAPSGASAATPRTATEGSARAQALFDAGLRAARAEKWDVALERFLESHHLERAPGTTLNVARCRENLGQLAEAIRDFEAVLAEVPPSDERAEYAKSRIAELEPRVGYVTFSSNAELSGARVYFDGEELPDSAFDEPFPANPGHHEISVWAPGRDEEVIRLSVSAGQRAELTLASERTRVPEPNDLVGTRKLLGYGSLGLGAAGVVVGAVTGIMALDRKNTMESNCDGQHCNAEGLGASHSGEDFATVSTISFGASIAFLSAGVVLLYLDGAANTRRVGLVSTPGGAQLILGGSL